ncbi:glycosyltransferase [Erythrobacter sp. 3-20A1M]|uniref:glycosyltransferase family 2 protein n=1 Tax=Erythrobacter sp. 3-20A1M TaxID=2653850 RepID=UPI001BFC5596|nr:glycosyltransferase family A protein [Erythrobacter sp. 3-20A1M]QWC57441.1 glycosyltransferase [Erythrobacter sp. 3-20A1M]
MKTPRFSVIIPVHNAEKTISAAIESVLRQSFKDFEIIVIDDGSTDDSVRKMLRFARDDERVRSFAKNREGVSATRNQGADLARGEFLAFLDADDCWTFDKLSRHNRLHIENEDIEASYAKIAFRSEMQNGQLAKPMTFSSVPDGPLDLATVLPENPVCTTSNLVIKRETFVGMGGFRKGMNHAEDQEFLARFVDEGRRIVGIDHWLVDYRMSPDGLSCDYEAMLAGWRTLAAKFADRFDMRSAEAVYCRYLARRILRAGGPAPLARQMAFDGVRSDWRAFFSDTRRGALTLGAAIGSSLMPARVRANVFA